MSRCASSAYLYTCIKCVGSMAVGVPDCLCLLHDIGTALPDPPPPTATRRRQGVDDIDAEQPHAAYG